MFLTLIFIARGTNYGMVKPVSHNRLDKPLWPTPILAFTLIELLVVVAILGLLSALVVPAVGSARASANKAKCASNLRQLWAGWMAYANDHDNRLPSAAWINANTHAEPGICNYLGLPASISGSSWTGATVFTCPPLQANPATATKEKFWRTYSVNANAIDTSKQRLTRIKSPASFALAMDGAYDPARSPNERYTKTVKNEKGILEMIQKPHHGHANVLFADGHVAPDPENALTDESRDSIFWVDP